MADSDRMPKVDFTGLKTAHEYAKAIEKENLERALKLRKLRSNNIKIGGLLAAAVLGIYSYSIISVKQETFLDDFEEPLREKV